MAPHSSTLAWKIPWMEEPGRLQSMARISGSLSCGAREVTKFDKSKYSKAGKEQHPGKVVSTKRPITKPPTKDKAVLNSVRWAAKEHRSQAGGRTRATCQQASWEAVGTSGKPDSLTLLYCWGPFCPHLHQLEENVSFDAPSR